MEWIFTKDQPFPEAPGTYYCLLPGDSESIDGHTIYEFGDYPDWGTFEGLDDGQPIWRMHTSDPDGMIAFAGPYILPELPS